MQNIRSILFWKWDILKGRTVRTNLNQIEKVLESNMSDFALSHVQTKTEDLIRHARNTTDFYKDHESLEEFPIIDKNIVRENLKSFISNNHNTGKLKKVTTSGSTGVPFMVYHDRGKQLRQMADNIYFNHLCHHHVGDSLYFLRIWNQLNRLSRFKRFITNIRPIETSELSIQNTKKLVADLEGNSKRKALLAYSSTYEILARNIKELGIEKIESNVSCIFTMAEELSRDNRTLLSQVFSCPVMSRYSNSENGFIAHQVPFLKDAYLINTASFYVEIVGLHDDLPVMDGQPGRIVVTDLHNYSMPMIRYDTGDVGVRNVLKYASGNKCQVLSRIEGRRLDFITTEEGALISPHIIDYTLRAFEEIRQFQITQNTIKKFTLKINLEKGKSIKEEEVILSLKRSLGMTSVVDIEYINEIPLLSSGKRKIVVNEMSK